MTEENIFDKKEAIGFTTTGIIVSGMLSFALYGIGHPVGLAIDENLMPVDDTQHAGQDIALAQYGRMFDRLSEKQNQYSEVKTKFATNGNIEKAPSILLKEVPLTKEEQTFYDTGNKARKEIVPLQNELTKLAKTFHDSALLDKRLSEENIEDLFARFSTDIGNLQEITGYETPDFADIDGCRIGNVEEIVVCTNQNNSGEATDVTQKAFGYGGFTILMLLLVGALREEYKNSNKYKSRPKRSKHGRKGIMKH